MVLKVPSNLFQSILSLCKIPQMFVPYIRFNYINCRRCQRDKFLLGSKKSAQSVLWNKSSNKRKEIYIGVRRSWHFSISPLSKMLDCRTPDIPANFNYLVILRYRQNGKYVDKVEDRDNKLRMYKKKIF